MNIASLLRQFTIRTRMLGAVGMIVALLVALGATGWSGLHRLEAAGDDLEQHNQVEALAMSNLRGAMGDLRRYEKDLVINSNDAAKRNEFRGKWQAALEVAQAQLVKLSPEDQPKLVTVTKEFTASLGQYAEATKAVFKDADEGRANEVWAINAALGNAKKAVHDAEVKLAQMAELLAADTKETNESRHATTRQAYLVFGGVMLVAALVMIPLTLSNMAAICSPIAQAQRVAERIATGDLTNHIDSDGDDETAHLLRALTAMQDGLRAIVGQVRESADSIQVASAEVASGNTDLSHRTEQAASSLQQTASSMEQLTGNVRQTSDAASQANQLAASASSVAQRGGEVVSQVVSTMDEINHSSKRIADIIGTIDGIAFQTNILALNAAVEAARAGEQGRGFAVVAGEVRSLAQRSAEAAREIKSLISTSVEKVDTGARLVQDAGSTMGEIVASVQRVTDIIGEITAASREQSGGIDQVNGAVNSLDQMTQQNAALVEQSAAAAESLRDQASRLSEVVSRFQIGGASHHSPARAPAPAARQRVVAATKPAPRTAAPAPQVAAVAESQDWESF